MIERLNRELATELIWTLQYRWGDPRMPDQHSMDSEQKARSGQGSPGTRLDPSSETSDIDPEISEQIDIENFRRLMSYWGN